MRFAPGERFDRYVIEAALGQGGMARVYRATDSILHRQVALKVVDLREDERERSPSMPEVGEWMLHEARAAAALDHPNVVTIHDVGEIDGVAYIAMELIEGRSLRTLIGDATIPIEERIRWLVDVARALAAAHKRGLVHRDVKPENVMVREDGMVKVLDFGIARRPQLLDPNGFEVTRDPRLLGDAKSLLTLGGKGIILGTPRYMAPEQMAGEALDARADQFSWGVVAYELLSGRSTWKSDDDLLLVAEILSRDPEPLANLVTNVPRRVTAAIHKTLSKSPDDRFAQVDEIVRALEPYGTSARRPPSSLPPSQPPPKAQSAGDALPESSGSRGGALRIGRVAGVVLAVAAASVAVGLFVTHARAPLLKPPPVASDRAALPSGACASSSDCVRAHGGQPYVCHPSDGACVAIESDDCKVLAGEGDVANDDTIWLGAMFPLTGDDADSFGVESVHALDLARRELMSISHGLPAAKSGGAPRPIALVACDDNVDPMRAAHHLVDDVRVPAVVGFQGSQEVIDLATSLFIPKGVLAVATQNRSSLIATIPHPSAGPRLVWRTTINSAGSAEPASDVVSEILEPELRALPGVLAPGEPLRVAFLHPRTTAGMSAADALFTHLTFNGKSALENGASYRAFPHGDPSNLDSIKDDAALVPQIVRFRPHVIIYMSFHGVTKHVLAKIESSWPAREKFLPRFVSNGYMLGDDFFEFLGKNVERRRRYVGVNPTTATAVNAKMTARYNDAFSPAVSVASGPAAVYDAFYVLAYAAYAAGDVPLTGTSLARGIARLVPPGLPVDVGPSMLFDGFNALGAGGNVDLNGAATGLDFDVTTGDSPADFAVLCVKPDANGAAAEASESGVVWRVRTKKLEGLPLRCP